MTARLSHTHTPTSISIESLAITDMFSNFPSSKQQTTTAAVKAEHFLHNIIFMLHFYYTLYSLTHFASISIYDDDDEDFNVFNDAPISAC